MDLLAHLNEKFVSLAIIFIFLNHLKLEIQSKGQVNIGNPYLHFLHLPPRYI